jgi:hypothetical protein
VKCDPAERDGSAAAGMCCSVCWLARYITAYSSKLTSVQLVFAHEQNVVLLVIEPSSIQLNIRKV